MPWLQTRVCCGRLELQASRNLRRGWGSRVESSRVGFGSPVSPHSPRYPFSGRTSCGPTLQSLHARCTLLLLPSPHVSSTFLSPSHCRCRCVVQGRRCWSSVSLSLSSHPIPLKHPIPHCTAAWPDLPAHIARSLPTTHSQQAILSIPGPSSTGFASNLHFRKSINTHSTIV